MGSKITPVDGTAARDEHNIISRVRLYYSPEFGCVKGVKARHGWENPPNLMMVGSDAWPEAGALSITAGERITSVSWAATGGCISYLSLRTNKGNSVTAGQAEADKVATFTAKGDEYLAAFKGATSTDSGCSPLAALSFRWGFDDCDAEEEEEETPAPAPAPEEEEEAAECNKSLTCFGVNGGSLGKCAGLACDTKTNTIVCRSKMCFLNPLVGRACVDEGAASCPSGMGDNLIAAKLAAAQAVKEQAKQAAKSAKGAKPSLDFKVIPVEVPVPEMPTISKGSFAMADVTFPTFKIAVGAKAAPAVMQDGLGLGHKKLDKLIVKASKLAALASKVPTVSVEKGEDKTFKVPTMSMPTIKAGGLKAKTLQVPVVNVAFPNKAHADAAAAGDAAAAAALASGMPAVPAVNRPNPLQDAVMDKLADTLEAAAPVVGQKLSQKIIAAEPLLAKVFGEPPETADVNVITNTGAPGGLVTLESQYELLNRAQSEPRLFGTILRGFPQALSGAFRNTAAQARAASSTAAPARRRLMGKNPLAGVAAKAASVGPAVETVSAAVNEITKSKAADLAAKPSYSVGSIPDNFFAKNKMPVAFKIVDVVDLADLAQCKWSVCGAVTTEGPAMERESPAVVVEEEAKEEVDTEVMVASKKGGFFQNLRAKAAVAPKLSALGAQLMSADMQAGGAVAAGAAASVDVEDD
jgi:hypothetical protein